MDLKAVEISVSGSTTFSLSEERDVQARILEVVQQKLPIATARGIVSVRFVGYVRFIASSAIQSWYVVDNLPTVTAWQTKLHLRLWSPTNITMVPEHAMRLA